MPVQPKPRTLQSTAREVEKLSNRLQSLRTQRELYSSKLDHAAVLAGQDWNDLASEYAHLCNAVCLVERSLKIEQGRLHFLSGLRPAGIAPQGAKLFFIDQVGQVA